MDVVATHNDEPTSRHYSPRPLWVEAIPKLHSFFVEGNPHVDVMADQESHALR